MRSLFDSVAFVGVLLATTTTTTTTTRRSCSGFAVVQRQRQHSARRRRPEPFLLLLSSSSSPVRRDGGDNGNDTVGGDGDSDDGNRRARKTKNEKGGPRQRNRSRRGRYSERNRGGDDDDSDDAALQRWRVFGVEVHPDRLVSGDEGKRRSPASEPPLPASKRDLAEHPAVLEALFSTRLRVPKQGQHEEWSLQNLPDGIADVRVVRKSLDARLSKKRRQSPSSVDEIDAETAGPRYSFVIDVDLCPSRLYRSDSSSDKKIKPPKHQPGRLEKMPLDAEKDLTTRLRGSGDGEGSELPVVVIVGAGPAGLFCALQLARSRSVRPILLERGQPVESRGRDIGSLIHSRSLDSESNFAYGEGGAGTWSDGKLTTRIGRNSDAVRFVLQTLVEYGAPDKILVDGSPHLGTDNLVRLLRNMRNDLRAQGGEIRFGCKVTDLSFDEKNGSVRGVEYEQRPVVERNMPEIVAGRTDGEFPNRMRVEGDAVVLATGHSARDVYVKLHESGVQLEPKGFAVGFRVEHPQKLINKIQYGNEWGPTVVTGKKTTDLVNKNYFESESSSGDDVRGHGHEARLPVPSYRLATDEAYDGTRTRSVYSFCMCPGGQIVPSSTEPDEVCVNGMSFSKRDSVWANSALVVSVAPNDPILEPYRKEHGVLAGVAFQRDMERRASEMGGGNFTVPVQRLTDFLAGRPSTSSPSSSYRLGVKPAACHEIYPPDLVQSLRVALTEHFEKRMPGFICEDGLLHAVETRTSSPVRVARNRDTLEAVGAVRLFPAGEGAGFAGGIVSAAVDGIAVADAVLDSLGISSRRKMTSGKLDTYY